MSVPVKEGAKAYFWAFAVFDCVEGRRRFKMKEKCAAGKGASVGTGEGDKEFQVDGDISV